MTAILEAMAIDEYGTRLKAETRPTPAGLIDMASDAYAGLRSDGPRILASIQLELADMRWMEVHACAPEAVRLEWAWEELFAKLMDKGRDKGAS